MNRLLTTKLVRNYLMRLLSVVVFIGAIMMFSACRGSDSPQRVFAEKLTKAQSYKVEGIMESYYESGRKQNEFKVLYKYPEMIKVEIKSGENADKQIILKNNEGVYILIPAVNKNFKIKATGRIMPAILISCNPWRKTLPTIPMPSSPRMKRR